MLSDVESSEIHALLDNAISWLTDNARGMESSFVEALSTRLLFRQEFLSTLELDTSVIQSRETENSQACLDLIDAIESSMHLGKPVEESFSCKIQRRLATTVPPRPMVKINIADAISFLRRFFKDVIDVQGVLDTQGSYDLLVSTHVSVWGVPSGLSSAALSEIGLGTAVPRSSTVSLRSLSHPVFPVE